MYATSLRCTACAREHPLDVRAWCDACLAPDEPTYDREAQRAVITRQRIAAGPHTLWRYADLLPVAAPAPGALPVGMTPLLPAPRLADELGLGELYVKVETANPTHSFKDRVVSLASAKAVEAGLT